MWRAFVFFLSMFLQPLINNREQRHYKRPSYCRMSSEEMADMLFK